MHKITPEHKAAMGVRADAKQCSQNHQVLREKNTKQK
jgi:hypothetical protein